MSNGLEESMTISVPKGTLLVIHEYLARSYDAWHKSGGEGHAYALLPPDTGERNALWQLEGAIERLLPELFSPEYHELIWQWKRELITRFGE